MTIIRTESGRPKSGSCKIIRCSCGPHSQDKIHGRGLRVHIFTEKHPGGWRCTVCGDIKR